MTKRELSSMFIKLMGLYSIIKFLPNLFYFPLFAKEITEKSEWLQFLSFVALAGIWFGVGLLIIRQSERIAVWLYPEDSALDQLTHLDFEDIQVLGYNFLGLLLFVQAFPQICTLFWAYHERQAELAHHLTNKPFVQTWLRTIFQVTIQLVLGVGLFFRARGLANLWRKVQHMRFTETKAP